jgi:NAD(P)-dependent dehydrogenase (short-subunit alcohol dehydrogenase family)
MPDLQERGSLDQAVKRAGVQDRVTIDQLDVTSAVSIDSAVASTLSQTDNRLDAVVHNAGVAVAGALEDTPESELRRVMETNFFGVLALTRALLPTFRTQRRGRLAIVSSEAAFMGRPTISIYCASKWALEGWAEAIAYELELFGIEVILIEPGPYRTEIWERAPRFQPPDSPYHSWVQHVFRAGIAHAASVARDPKEVAVAIADAIETRRPRFRYPVGPSARLAHFLKGKLPNRLLRRITTLSLGFSRKRQ